jgi:hypothetical protein
MKRMMFVGAVLALVLGATPAALAAGGLSGKFQKQKFVIAFTKTAYARYFNVNPTYHHWAVVEDGKISIGGNKITFKTGTMGVASPCKGKYPGTYTFTVTGNTLKFKLVSDKCAARTKSLAGSWTRTQVKLTP